MLLHGMLRHLSTARKKEFKVILLTIIIFYVIQLIAFIIDPEIKKKKPTCIIFQLITSVLGCVTKMNYHI